MIDALPALRTALAPSPDAPPLTFDRAVMAMVWGAFAGAVGTGLAIGAMLVAAGGVVALPMAVMIQLPAVPLAFLAWLIGLLLIGGPGWFLLHRLGWRSLPVALLFGAAMGLAGCLGFLMGPPDLLPVAALLGGVGIGVSGVIWVQAYGRAGD